MYNAGRFRKTIALGAAVFLLSAEIPAAADNLVAHHARYVLSLTPDSKNSQVTAADGLLDFDLKDTCDGWATDLKMKFVMSLDSGDSGTIETTQVTWESKDGTAYRYLIKNSGSGGREEQMRGEARLDKPGGTVTATADLPTRAEAKLPPGVLFPTAHTRLILQKAAEGESVVTAEFFDGSASTEAMQVSALIGVGEKDWPGLPKKIPELAGKTSYPIGLAYFLNEDNDGTPDQEQHLQLYENGVLGSLTITFGTIKVRAVLDSLKVQPEPAC
jgi:hypothetical protein